MYQQRRPRTLQAPKEVTTREVTAIPAEMTRIENEGRHLGDVIFKNSYNKTTLHVQFIIQTYFLLHTCNRNV